MSAAHVLRTSLLSGKLFTATLYIFRRALHFDVEGAQRCKFIYGCLFIIIYIYIIFYIRIVEARLKVQRKSLLLQTRFNTFNLNPEQCPNMLKLDTCKTLVTLVWASCPANAC